MPAPRPARVPSFDLLRVLATFAVILLHAATSQLGAVPFSSGPWTAMIVWDGLTRWSVPAFFMLSGALFLASDKPLSVILRKNALRVLAAFLFWSFLYALFSQPEDGKTFITLWLSGHYHLWFCWAILGLYLLVPLLRLIVKQEKAARYYLLLAFLFASLLPMLVSLVWAASPRLSSLLSAVLGKIDLQFPMGYAGLFVLGYVLRESPLSRRAERLLYALGVLGLLFTPLSALLYSAKFGRETTNFYPYLMPNVAVSAAALFHFLNRRVKRSSEIVRLLSDASFGAYLCHVMIMGALARLGFTPLLFTPWASVPLVAAAVAVLSFALSALLRKIPFLGKYIV